MDKITRLSAEDRENLPAYLDGELDEGDTRRIEQVLANSSVARNDVELLARTYDLLDVLPRPKAPTEFVEKTVATAKLEGYKKPLSQQRWFQTAQQLTILAGWSAFMIAAAAGGFSLAQRLSTPPEEVQLLDKLPIIQNFEAYSEVKDVDFLQRLSGEKDLLRDMNGEIVR